MKESQFYTYADVMRILGCKRTTAYKVMKRVNNKLMAKGIAIVPGKVSKIHFLNEYGLPREEDKISGSNQST